MVWGCLFTSVSFLALRWCPQQTRPQSCVAVAGAFWSQQLKQRLNKSGSFNQPDFISKKKSLRTAQGPMAGEWELSTFAPIALCPPIEPSVALVMHPSIYKCSELTMLVFGIPASPSPTRAQKKFLIIFWESTWKKNSFWSERKQHFWIHCSLLVGVSFSALRTDQALKHCFYLQAVLVICHCLGLANCPQSILHPVYAKVWISLQLPACCHDNSKISDET